MRHFPQPPPVFRGLATVLVFYGVAVAQNVWLLSGGVLAVLAILTLHGKLRTFGRFAGTVIFPVGLGLMIVWGLIRQGTPENTDEASVQAGVLYATIITLRLALFGAVFQAAFLTLPTSKLVHLLYCFGLRGRGLAIIVSTLNLWPNFRRQVENIVAARCARGLMSDRRLVTRVRQLPTVVRTLFITALGHGLERADSWEASGLIERLSNLRVQANRPGEYSRIVGTGLLTLAVLWAIAATTFAT